MSAYSQGASQCGAYSAKNTSPERKWKTSRPAPATATAARQLERAAAAAHGPTRTKPASATAMKASG